jgi:hypothetical protein
VTSLSRLLDFLATPLALLVVVVAARVAKPGVCDCRTWLPYEDVGGFGYEEWVCHLHHGHAGRHAGYPA